MAYGSAVKVYDLNTGVNIMLYFLLNLEWLRKIILNTSMLSGVLTFERKTSRYTAVQYARAIF